MKPTADRMHTPPSYSGSTWLRRAHCRATYAWRYSPSPLLARVRQLADGEIREVLPATYSTAGEHAPRIGYVGPYEGVKSLVSYVEQLLEQQGEQWPVRRTRHVTRRGLDQQMATADPDMLFHCATDRLLRDEPPGPALILPFRLHQVVRITGDFDAMMAQLHKNDRWRFRRNQQIHDWSWEHATRDEDLAFFLDRMHVPTMRAQFGRRAVSEDALTARECLFRQGRLFFLRSGRQRVAGALCRWNERHRTLQYRLNGVLDADPELRQEGSFTAIYYYLIRWAVDHGVSTVDLSGSVPFLARGIFQSKRRLHAEVVIAPTPARHLRIGMRVLRDTPAVRRFLVDNPLIALRRDGTLEAVYFHDDDRPPRHDVRWHSPGIGQARDIHLDGFLPATTGPRVSRAITHG